MSSFIVLESRPESGAAVSTTMARGVTIGFVLLAIVVGVIVARAQTRR